YGEVPGAGDPGGAGFASDGRGHTDLSGDRRVLGYLAVGVRPESHERELALVEQVLGAGPVELGGPGRCEREQARVEVERRDAVVVAEGHVPVVVDDHRLLSGLGEGGEPFRLDRALHVGTVARAVAGA